MRHLLWDGPGVYFPAFPSALGGWFWARYDDAPVGVYLGSIEQAHRIATNILGTL